MGCDLYEAAASHQLAAQRRSRPRGRENGSSRAVPRGARNATGRTRRAFDDPSAPFWRQHRLQGACRRISSVPADSRRRSTLLRGRWARAQGDGEISGTAIECPVEAQVTLDVRDDFPIRWPVARTTASWLTFGFHEDLGKAAGIAIEGMLDLMQREHGLTRSDALALGSVVVDLRITQIANKTLGVHAVLNDAALE